MKKKFEIMNQLSSLLNQFAIHALLGFLKGLVS